MNIVSTKTNAAATPTGQTNRQPSRTRRLYSHAKTLEHPRYPSPACADEAASAFAARQSARLRPTQIHFHSGAAKVRYGATATARRRPALRAPSPLGGERD